MDQAPVRDKGKHRPSGEDRYFQPEDLCRAELPGQPFKLISDGPRVTVQFCSKHKARRLPNTSTSPRSLSRRPTWTSFSHYNFRASGRPISVTLLQRTTRHDGYAISQRKRKRIEESFGWLKTIALLRKVRHRGIFKVGWVFTFAAAAYNLVRMRNLLATPVGAASVRGRTAFEWPENGR